MVGPKRCEIRPAMTHTVPPNAKRMNHSCGLMPLIAESLAWKIIAATGS